MVTLTEHLRRAKLQRAMAVLSFANMWLRQHSARSHYHWVRKSVRRGTDSSDIETAWTPPYHVDAYVPLCFTYQHTLQFNGFLFFSFFFLIGDYFRMVYFITSNEKEHVTILRRLCLWWQAIGWIIGPVDFVRSWCKVVWRQQRWRTDLRIGVEVWYRF